MCSVQNTIDLRPSLPPVRDQGPRGTCVAFAMTAFNEYINSHAVRLSEEFLYGCCKIIDQDSDEGTSLKSSCQALENYGQVLESLCPYSSIASGNFNNFLTATIRKEAQKYKITSFTRISAVQVETLLLSSSPVATAIEVHPSFSQPINNFIELPSPPQLEGYHAILLVGFDRVRNGKQYFILRNSWGTGWGNNGYAYMSYDYFTIMQRGAWIIAK